MLHQDPDDESFSGWLEEQGFDDEDDWLRSLDPGPDEDYFDEEE